SFEFLRDAAAELYALHTGQAWRPYTGSMVNRATMTAAMIDSRDFLNARRRADAQVLLPKGTRIAFAGGVDCNDHQRIWAVLDKVMAKHAEMVLLHGGTPRGAEKIAACWADARKVSQSCSSRTGHATRRRLRSSATTSSWKRCRSASSCSRAPASLTTWPTRPGRWASRCSTAARRAARKRRSHGFAAARNAAHATGAPAHPPGEAFLSNPAACLRPPPFHARGGEEKAGPKGVATGARRGSRAIWHAA